MTNSLKPQGSIRLRAWMVSLLAILGIYVSAISNHNIAIAVFAVVVGSLLFMNTVEMYLVSFFLLPFTMIFKTSTGGSSLFTYLVIIVACAAVLRRKKIRTDVLMLIMLVAIYLLFGMGDNITVYLKLLFNVIFFYGFISSVKQTEFHSIVLALSTGTIFSGIVGLQKQTVPTIASFFTAVKTEYIDGVETVRFSGLYLDPNYFSILGIVCLFGLAVYMLRSEVPKTVALILGVSLSVFGCMTLSKVFYISLVLGVVFLLIIYSKVSRNVFKPLITALVLGGVAYYFAHKSGIIDQIVFRFSAEDISKNRFNIWSDYIAYIQENVNILMFGAGINAELIGGNGAHNFYIEMAYYLGIVGSALYVLLYSVLLFSRTLIAKRKLINYSLLVVVLVMYATLGTLFMNDFAFVLLMVWMMLNTDMEHGKKNFDEKMEGRYFEKNIAAFTSN